MTALDSVPLQDTKIDTKLKVSALWITTLFVFAYVDIFMHFRADFLEGALDGEVVGTPFEVSQGFLVFALLYVVVPSLMVILSLALSAPINRKVNIAVSLVYVVTIALSCVGEDWAYYLIGSAIEVALLLTLATIAWKWPSSTR